jgi:hypothetical protein
MSTDSVDAAMSVSTNVADSVVSGVIAVIALIIAHLEPSDVVVYLTIALLFIKICHSAFLLRKDLKARGD